MTYARPDAVEKLRRMADACPETGGQFFIQRDIQGRYAAGIGIEYHAIHESGDADTLDEAIDKVAAAVVSACATRLNRIRHAEEPQLRNTLRALERLGYK